MKAARTLPAALLVTLVAVVPAHAQDEEKVLGWKKTAEVSLVSTSGNSETETLGLKAAFVRKMERSTLTLDTHALRAEATTTSRTAIGPTPADATVTESSMTLLNAENFSFGGRFNKQFSDSIFWFAGIRWEKNEFAGFSERTTGVGGVGHTWWERDDSHFRTDYALTYTTQDDLVPSPGLDDAFLGARLSYDYGRTLTASSEFGSVLILDQNLDESEDRRADFTNWLSVSISDRLALKVSLQALWDNLPALASLPLEFPAGTPTGESVLFELDSTDTVLTTALVVKF